MALARHDSPLSADSLPHRILVVGGSYAGLTFIGNILDHIDGKPSRPSHRPLPDFAGKVSRRGVEITLLDERDGFFHTVGAPLAHTNKKHVVSFWKEFSILKELKHPALTIARGRIDEVDCEARRATYVKSESQEKSLLDYDHLVIATGLSRQWPIVPKSHLKDRYIKDALQHIDTLAASTRVVVIGGGAVGIEVSAEMKVSHPSVHVTLVHSRDKLLSNEPLPDEFKNRVAQVMEEEGVDLVLGQRATVHAVPGDKVKKVKLTNDTTIQAETIIDATARSPPNSTFLPGNALDADGFVKITPTLTFPDEVPNSTSHFAIGDVAAWPGIKRAGGAMFMGQVAASNIYSRILRSEDKSADFKQTQYPVWPAMMALAVGTQALAYSGPGSEITYGKDTMAENFGEDLAWTSCLRYMRLSEAVAEDA